jgi:serine/threonine protein kinase
MRERLGKYALQRSLGRGAFGEVYYAIDTFTEKEVAIKMIDSGVLDDPEVGTLSKKQFLSEASLAGKFNHPHIVTILEAVVDDDPGYIAMEFVPGGTLADHLEEGVPFPLERAVEICFKCCGALDYAARHGIVHRDLKPANIMVVEGSDIKLTDFGAAWFRHSQVTQIADIGTPLYESPEQIGGQSLTSQSDMFSLGVLFYQMLTGVRPFRASTITVLFDKILKEDPEPPSRLNPALPPRIDDIVLRALRKDPAERYATWAEFALDLADVGRLSVFANTIPDSERFSSLRRMPVLKTFSDAELWELVKAGKWSRLPARRVVLREGDEGSSMFFLADGELQVTKGGRLLNIIDAGECFGEMACILAGAMPRHATLTAASDVTVVEFERDVLDTLSESCRMRFAKVLLKVLVERVALADSRILQLIQELPRAAAAEAVEIVAMPADTTLDKTQPLPRQSA